MQNNQEFDSSKYQENSLQQEQGGHLQVHQQIQKVTLKQGFSKSQLEQVQDSLYGKIVEFDLYDNHSKLVIKEVIQFISEQNSLWKGVEMSFTYQQVLLDEEDLFNLSKAISTFQNLDTFTLTFGSLIVSLLYAEDSPNAPIEWDKAYSRKAFSVQSMKQLLASIEMVVSKSPNLKVFKFDVQPQHHQETSEGMLQGLFQVNQQLNNCKDLEVYEISMNHCYVQAKYYDQSLVNDQKDPISLFFLSFEMLLDKKRLTRFTLNICSFILKEEHFKLFSQVFEYLQNKPLLIYFSIDHSSSQILSSKSVNHIALGLSSFLISNRNALATFYVSLNSYKAQEQDLDQIILLFPLISQCIQLERLSLRLEGWKSENISQQKRFLSALTKLQQIRKLSFFHFQKFSLLNVEQRMNLYQGMSQLLGIMEKRDLKRKQLEISKTIQQKQKLVRLEQASSIVEEYLTIISNKNKFLFS